VANALAISFISIDARHPRLNSRSQLDIVFVRPVRRRVGCVGNRRQTNTHGPEAALRFGGPTCRSRLGAASQLSPSNVSSWSNRTLDVSLGGRQVQFGSRRPTSKVGCVSAFQCNPSPLSTHLRHSRYGFDDPKQPFAQCSRSRLEGVEQRLMLPRGGLARESATE
jgi:hypothetical protein